MSVQILVGDCRDRLRELPDASVHCCVTSPPYFGLRDYGTVTWEGGDPDHTHDRVPARGGRGGSGAPGKNTANAFPSDLPASLCSCGAARVDRQVGLEPTPDEFVAAMVEVFREVRRVLRADGTLWLNLGDSYSGSGKGVWNAPEERKAAVKETYRPSEKVHTSAPPPGLKQKDLIGIPWMVAFALRADGWYLRQEIIWAKPNTMPESVRDRCTKSHEHIFLLTKSPRYYYDSDAIAEPAQDWSTNGPGTGIKETDHYGAGNGGNGGLAKLAARYKSSGNKERKPRPGAPESHTGNACGSIPLEGKTRNKRSVWTVSPQSFDMELCQACDRVFDLSGYRALKRIKHKGKADEVVCTCGASDAWLSHFATFPPDLIEPCILAGCPERVCATCGSPHVPLWERDARPPPVADSELDRYGDGSAGVHRKVGGQYQKWLDEHPKQMTGYAPACSCGAETVAGIVLDPFGGAATTGLVTDRLGRNAILIELNPKYVTLMRARLARDGGMFSEVAVA